MDAVPLRQARIPSAARRCSSVASVPAAAGAPLRQCAGAHGLKTLGSAVTRAIARLRPTSGNRELSPEPPRHGRAGPSTPAPSAPPRIPIRAATVAPTDADGWAVERAADVGRVNRHGCGATYKSHLKSATNRQSACCNFEEWLRHNEARGAGK